MEKDFFTVATTETATMLQRSSTELWMHVLDLRKIREDKLGSDERYRDIVAEQIAAIVDQIDNLITLLERLPF